MSELKPVLEVSALIIASVGGVITAWRAVSEMRNGRNQRQQELAWSQAREARTLVDEIRGDRLANDAMLMLDWSGRSFKTQAGQPVTVTTPVMYDSLRTDNLNFDDAGVYVRDSFDQLFDHFERVEWAIQSDLTCDKDVVIFLRYYVEKMAKNRPVFEKFLAEYDFDLTLSLLDRFEGWRGAKLSS